MMKKLMIMTFAVALMGCEPNASDNQIITGEQFQSEIAGKQLVYYDENGQVIGHEYYSNSPSNAAVWRYTNGDCLNGRTYVSDARICFAYGGDIADACHTVSKLGGGSFGLSNSFQIGKIVSTQSLTCNQ